MTENKLKGLFEMLNVYYKYNLEQLSDCFSHGTNKEVLLKI